MAKQEGVVARHHLTDDERTAVLELARLCNQRDGLDIKLNPEMMKHRSGQHTDDFVFYAGGQVVGFLGMYRFKASEIEVSGLVHPDYRRRGIFRELYQAARQSCAERQIPEMLWICERGSASGKAFLETLDVKYSISEYVMELDLAALPPAPPAELEFREARADDGPLVAKIMADGFEMTEKDTQEFFQGILTRPDRTLQIVSAGGRPIATIGTHMADTSAYIFGFVVVAELRGQGYGRRILLQRVHQLVAAGTQAISLEVVTLNARALNLYQSCGFRTTSANDYYTEVVTC